MNQKDIELKWQNIWEEKKVFEPKIEKDKEKFFITVPYPYGNSAVHIGHGKTFTTADIITRYQRLKGKNVLFPMGYHVSGSPVLAVADGIKRGDEKQIKITRDALCDYIQDEKEQNDIIEKFKEAKEIATYFSKTIETSFKSIGLSIDWSRDFTTGDEIYSKFIEWQYKILNEKGILIQGKYPILYSAEDKNAVGEDDIKDGDIDKVSMSEMTYILFKLNNKENDIEDEFLVASTLRPDSLFNASNLFVNPEMNLVKIKVNNQFWIVSKKAQVKIMHQFENVEFIEDIKTEDLFDKKVIVPILNKEVPIYKANFCDENHGTGIVYSSPADSVHDYLYLFEILYPNKKLSEFENEEPLKLIPITKTKDKKGNEIKYKFDIPAYSKLFEKKVFETENNLEKLEDIKQELYKEAHFGAVMINCGKEFDETPLKNNVGAEKVKNKLKELNLGGIFYETSRRAITRSGDEVIVANLEGQWFLDYSKEETKNKAFEFLESIEYKPEKLKDTQKGYIDWVKMRPCARRRGIGTHLPFDKEWIIEPLSDSTIYQIFYCISHIIKRENIESSKLEPILFDYIFLNKGNLEIVSEETKIDKNIIEEMKEQFEYWKSFDFRFTASPHMSNHLSFLIYHYALIFEKDYWPKSIAVGGLVIKDGAKISKSKGNGISLIKIRDLYGVDLFRFYIATASNYDVELDFRDNEIKQLEKKFVKWKELIIEASNRKLKNYEEFSDINKWLISKFYSSLKDYFKLFDELRIREAYIPVFYDFLSSINYHQRRTSEDETYNVLRFILEDYLLVMTPTTSHFCEEINEKIGNSDYISLKSFDFGKIDNYVNKELEEKEGIVENLISEISRIRDSKQISNISEIKIYQASNERFALFDRLKEELEKTRNIKEIFENLKKDFSDDFKFIQKFVPKTLGSGLSYYLPKDKEKELLESLISFIEKEFDCKVNILNCTDENKNNMNLLPSKFLVDLD